MKAIIKQVGPFTVKARRDRFSTLANSIISQQISTAAARTIRQRLHEAVAPAELNAENLLAFTAEDLRELGVSKQKASYLHDLAAKVKDETVDLTTLSRKTDEEVIGDLTQIKGIGRWTAQMFLIFSLARMDILPVDDLGIQKAVQQHYELDELPDADTLEEIAQPWRPFASIASWYLWQSIN